ncbi:MAG: DJ-1/PfpI family protein [Ramlibacter sp.]|nr:DJ-1/PfpI family protein [Ramlibacter sp.]
MPGAQRKVAVLLEHHFEADLERMRDRFSRSGIVLDCVSHLWGLDSLRFHDLDFQTSVDVGLEIENVDMADYRAVLIPDGYAADRLRYQNEFSAVNTAPATRFVRAALERGLVLGVSGFGIWLLTVAPDLLRGKRITTRPEAAADARNAGATIVDGIPAVWVHDNLVTSVGASATDAFVDRIIERISAQDRP